MSVFAESSLRQQQHRCTEASRLPVEANIKLMHDFCAASPQYRTPPPAPPTLRDLLVCRRRRIETQAGCLAARRIPPPHAPSGEMMARLLFRASRPLHIFMDFGVFNRTSIQELYYLQAVRKHVELRARTLGAAASLSMGVSASGPLHSGWGGV